jgi:hypothetical protein
LKLTVQVDAQNQELKATLVELEQLHQAEAVALRRLSKDEIDSLTDRKLAAWERLRAIAALSPPRAEDRAALERVRRAALLNQILLHHARDAIRNILQSASGQALVTPSQRPVAVQDGLRVNFRG